MTQNNNQQPNSSDDRFYEIDPKLILSSHIVSNKEDPKKNIAISPLFDSTTKPKWLKLNWWQNLSLRNRVTLLTSALSFTSAFVAGGIGYYSHNNFASLVVGSSVVVVVAGTITAIFTQKFAKAIANANHTINQLGNGELDNWGDKQLDELDLLGSNLSELSERLQGLADEQGKINQQQQLIGSVAFRTRQTAKMDVLLQTAVDGARDILNTDRVIVYCFGDDGSGRVIAESVADGLPKILDEAINDPCFKERVIECYEAGSIKAINDIYQEPNLTDCYLRMLQQYKVRANLVFPIRQKGKLMGLLIVHHCQDARVWETKELNFCSQLATEIEYSIEYLNLIAEREQTAKKAWFFGDIAFCVSQTKNLEEVLNITVRGARELLKCDRVAIFQFDRAAPGLRRDRDRNGKIIAESVVRQYPSMLHKTIDDPDFRELYLDLSRNGRVRAINNLLTEPGLSEFYIRTLKKYEVKANLVVPLRQEGKLTGLLVAHHCSTPRVWQDAELDFCAQLGTQLEYALERLSFIDKIKFNTSKVRLFGDITFITRQNVKLEQIFPFIVRGARKVLQTDRVLLYKFNADWSGIIIAESVGDSWVKTLNTTIDDPYFKGRYVDLYRNVKVKAIDNIYREPEIADRHVRTLEQYDVKANLVAPIRKDGKLYGLLIAHHCSAPRVWQPSEIDFFSELVTQTEYILDRVSSIAQLERAKKIADKNALEQRQQTEVIQHQLKTLVGDIQNAVTGNLTVRTPVTSGEIGVIARFFNTTLENLQKIVLQVQSTSGIAIETVQGSEDNINNLSDDASRQAEAITVVLGQIQAMTESIHGVADNAQSAKQMVKQANETLENGDRTMNLTVDGILAIQETVEEAAQKVKRLGEASQKISRVVNLIRDLANQTHVLALNASIEANGTSSEGKGFAVVAEEVRSLSEQSTAATKEIEQILEEIQTETSQVATAMEAGREQVIAGTNLVETTRQQLTSIARVSGQIRQLVEEMARAATAQAKTSASVFKTMQEIETIAQQTSAKSVASAKSFNQLLEVAEELKDSVARFKVN